MTYETDGNVPAAASFMTCVFGLTIFFQSGP